jgi:hypothetical protein
MQPYQPQMPQAGAGTLPSAGNQPQQGGGMSFGMGGIGPGGMPRIKVGVGDYHPNKLLSAVVKGQGYDNPRVFGLVMLGLAVAFAIINVILAVVVHIYFPYLYILSGPLGWGGLFMLITGQPKTTTDGSPVPMWTRIGLGACIGIGILIGIAMSVFTHGG